MKWTCNSDNRGSDVDVGVGVGIGVGNGVAVGVISIVGDTVEIGVYVG